MMMGDGDVMMMLMEGVSDCVSTGNSNAVKVMVRFVTS
jgi:hypothetical protein